jgi:uncharacterized membrane protein YccC
MTSATVNSAASADSERLIEAAPSVNVSEKVQNSVKTALSLTLAYLIPMALGLQQPQTAAITVMLIAAATGLVSESLSKGFSRILGTIAGAIIGLGLIALFPQDRASYLIAVSMTVAVIFYLYNAYQADGTVFMLTAVVTLMVFNGGDAEGAFLYGVERAFMTVFGVVTYTLVASFLWPVRAADNTQFLAAQVQEGCAALFAAMKLDEDHTNKDFDAKLAKLHADSAELKNQFSKVKNSIGVAQYSLEWNAVLSCYEEMQGALLPALRQVHSERELQRYITNYELVTEHIDTQFCRVRQLWQGNEVSASTKYVALVYDVAALRGAGHLLTAKIVGRADMLATLQRVLADLECALQSLLLDATDYSSERKPRTSPTFVWLDRENFNTALRAFVSFWVATAIWILFNPPGGFIFVTLCTTFIPLLSYTPVTPKLLIILLTVSFVVAAPVYVHLLPLLTHWLELALFLFLYAFIGLFLFPGPAAIFFLLGLFVLGIQNDMNYHFDVIALVMLMFYMISTTLLIALYFPFTSRAEIVYASLQRRFFTHCARSLNRSFNDTAWFGMALPAQLWQGTGQILLAKMVFWGPRIDTVYFNRNDSQTIAEYNQACTILLGELEVLEQHGSVFASNPLVLKARKNSRYNVLAELCRTLAQASPGEDISPFGMQIEDVETSLNQMLGDDDQQLYDQHQLAQFYVYLSVQLSILSSIEKCRISQQALDWQQLAETRF